MTEWYVYVLDKGNYKGTKRVKVGSSSNWKKRISEQGGQKILLELNGPYPDNMAAEIMEFRIAAKWQREGYNVQVGTVIPWGKGEI